MMRFQVRHFGAAALLAQAALLAPQRALATVPQGVTEQGRLFDNAGNPLNATVSLTFSLYASASGGTALWSETQPAVILDQGYFSAELGSVTPIPQSVWAGAMLYVGIAVNADPEMSPRQPTASVPYALVTNDAVGAIHPTTVSINGSLVIDSGGNWVGPATDLVGPTGPAGPAGAAGATGATGATGTVGPAGSAGPQGPQGPIGNSGAQGAAGAAGAAGASGATGAAGAAGANGSNGAQGAIGANGANGAQGAAGPIGATGSSGPQGPAGAQGAAGTNGVDGGPGATGAAGSNGADGAAGAQGATGAEGATGATGAAGAAGPTGAVGAMGPAGPMGPVGPTGATGAQGASGANGTSGVTGATGAAGATGATGPAGPQGPAGAIGATGAAGSNGAAGAAGSNGAQGAAGSNGAQGAAGSNGAQGAAGSNGAQGATGAGTTGAQGAAGGQGPTGPQGASGAQGAAGAGGGASVVGTTQPSNPATGTTFFNTSTSAFQIWTGSAWVTIGLGTASGSSSASAARSCYAILQDYPGSANGVYWIAPDGNVADGTYQFYCDMSGGGWTLVMNQVSSSLLPDVTSSVNAGSFGSLAATYRLGNPTITAIRPTVAWKLTDATNSVYFQPSCVVDWTNSLLGSQQICSTGYTSTSFAALFNGTWVQASANGIGINGSCIMRAFRNDIGVGEAFDCNADTSQTIRLWYQ